MQGVSCIRVMNGKRKWTYYRLTLGKINFSVMPPNRQPSPKVSKELNVANFELQNNLRRFQNATESINLELIGL